MGDLSDKYNLATPLQKAAAFLAILCAITAWIMILCWAYKSDTGERFMGGLNLGELLFNWHPVLMTSGFLLCFTISITSFRLIPLSKVKIVKPLHGILHFLAVVCICLGLAAVFQSNNIKSKNSAHIYYPNLFSLHSFIGLGAIILYFQNFLLGIISYGMPNMVSLPTKVMYMPIHAFLGMFAFITACCAILTGIMELNAESACDYGITTNEPDTNPAENYHKMPNGCVISNGAGVLVLVVLFCVVFTLQNYPKPKLSDASDAEVGGIRMTDSSRNTDDA